MAQRYETIMVQSIRIRFFGLYETQRTALLWNLQDLLWEEQS